MRRRRRDQQSMAAYNDFVDRVLHTTTQSMTRDKVVVRFVYSVEVPRGGQLDADSIGLL